LRRIEPSAFTKVSALGVEEQRVNVIIDFVSPPHERSAVGVGYRVDVSIVSFARNDAVIAPTSALFRDGAEWAVFVIEDGVAVRRTVRVGGRGPLQAWIESGLAAGDRVIVYPGDSVRDGVRVKVVRTAG
jgi:HlyD family secretion protein